MRRFTDKEKIEIVEKYLKDAYNCTKLAIEYGSSTQCIYQFLKRRNIKMKVNCRINRQYPFNENYFDKIDTEEKAYFLGLLYADGCNSEDINTISISLQEKDKYMLDRFNSAIGSSKPLSESKLSLKNPKWQNAFKLQFSSKNISQQLSKLGCFARKSFTLKFPTEEQVSSNLINHFLRGMWDGDGCISYGYYGKYKTFDCSSNLVSTEEFCKNTRNLIKNLSINCSIVRPKYSIKNNTTTRELYIGGNKQVRKFLDWLYKDSTIYLERKFQKYQYIVTV